MAHELLFIYTVPLYNHSNNATLLSLHVVALMGLSQNCHIYSALCGQTNAGVPFDFKTV